jgi:hypothetical protein
MTLYVLIHTSFVSANDILVTFGGLIVLITPDPKRAILKSVLKRRNAQLALRLAPPGVAPLTRNPGLVPVNNLKVNALGLRNNETTTIMIKKPEEV